MRRALPALLLASCYATTTAPVELGRIYAVDAPQARQRLPSTLFVPGILGSRITDPETGLAYWGSVLGDAPKPAKDPEDLRKLALDVTRDVAWVDLHDELVADAVLHVVAAETPFGQLELRGYPGVLEGVASWLTDEAEGRVTRVAKDDAKSGRTGLASAPYDWRLDLVASARQLAARVDAAVSLRQAATGEARVDLIGHSMGALVVRWYLMYGTADLRPDGSPPPLTWAGARNARNVVLVAPPNAGSPMVLESLVRGEKVSGMLPRYPAPLVGTFPSMYTMLPRARHATVVWADDETPVDVLDPTLWEKLGWGMFDPEQDEALAMLLPDAPDREARLQIVRAWMPRVLARARGIQAALDARGDAPDHLRVHLFAGDSRATPARYEVGRATGELRPVGVEPGDGRVTRRSALLDERDPNGPGGRLDSPIPWTTVHMGGGEHFSIVRDSAFLDGMLYLLLEDPHGG